MNMQKMGKLCKENMCMKLYRKGYTQYISDGITMVEMPRNFPALSDETEAASVFGWTDKQLEETSCEVEGLDVINGLYEVTGISMDDVSGEEIPCKRAPIGFTYAGMHLLVLRDERGGMYLRIAVMPIVFDDVFAAALDEIRAGMMLDALGRPKKREDENHDD